VLIGVDMRRQLSKKEFKQILALLEKAGFKRVTDFSLKGAYSRILKKDLEVVYDGNNKVIAVMIHGEIIPFIGSIAYFSGFKRVYVDRGAVKPITNGADIMAPGIRDHDPFSKDDYVVIFLEDVDVPIAVGKALINSTDISERGKVIKNLHYKGDKIWKYVSGG